MSFIADQTIMETRCVVRGASLHVVSGGSDGSKEFEIRLADGVFKFSAELDANIWRVRVGKLEDRLIIAEALLAFGHGLGFLADKIDDVLFLDKRSGLLKTSYRWVNAQ